MKKTTSIFLIAWLALSSLSPVFTLAQEAEPVEANTDRFGVEEPDIFARSELVLFQTIHGLILGAELCVLLQCDDERLVVGSVMGGGIGGLSLSLLNTDGGITSGHTLMLNSGTNWGFWNALALNLILDHWEDERVFTGTLMAGQLAGLGSAIYFWDQLRPQAGDVALVDSAGIWSGILAMYAVAGMELDMSTQEFFTLMLAATDLGAIAGAYYAVETPMPRGRVFLINTGGVVGAAIGFGMAVMIFGEEVEQPALFGLGFLGTLAGLATSFYLSEGWQLETSES